LATATPEWCGGTLGIGPDKARELYALGALRLGKVDVSKKQVPAFLPIFGIMAKWRLERLSHEGRKDDGTLIVKYPDNTNSYPTEDCVEDAQSQRG
jgi:hypothetical protein